MRAFKILIGFFFVMAMACAEGADTKSDTQTNKKKDLNRITQKAIENFNYTDYALSAEAETAVSKWEKYQELAIQINYLKQGDLSFFNSERELIMEFTEAFFDELPKDLNTNPISSRVTVVITALLKLNDDLRLDNISLQNRLDSLKQVLVAFANLNFQINKKLERDQFDKISPE
ncbi:hypothetical protein [uncultured Winogradskyella sp.]|uniref:hypothetical protein n=1 Tax=uncultured Winogradskyella sp. TaxID=395353 RepID=UPI003519C053